MIPDPNCLCCLGTGVDLGDMEGLARVIQSCACVRTGGTNVDRADLRAVQRVLAWRQDRADYAKVAHLSKIALFQHNAEALFHRDGTIAEHLHLDWSPETVVGTFARAFSQTVWPSDSPWRYVATDPPPEGAWVLCYWSASEVDVAMTETYRRWHTSVEEYAFTTVRPSNGCPSRRW